jgi:curved DNA-binding protein CbpA
VSNGLSYAAKLERYRLVIAANEILSDPVKRGAYDCYGAGWNGFPGVKSPRGPSEAADGWNTFGRRGRGGGPGGCSQNATWEDWERWYQRDEKPKQQPTYVSNSTFVALIIIFAALGGIGQATRAEKQTMGVIEHRDAVHRGVSKELVQRRKESTASGDPRERVHSFLRLRDHYGYHLVDIQEEQYRKLLTEPESCSSADIKTRSMDVYRQEDRPKI